MFRSDEGPEIGEHRIYGLPSLPANSERFRVKAGVHPATGRLRRLLRLCRGGGRSEAAEAAGLSIDRSVLVHLLLVLFFSSLSWYKVFFFGSFFKGSQEENRNFGGPTLKKINPKPPAKVYPPSCKHATCPVLVCAVSSVGHVFFGVP